MNVKLSTNERTLLRGTLLAAILGLASSLPVYTFAAGCPPSGAQPVNVLQQQSALWYEGVAVNGPSSVLYDIVVIGDGFTLEEQELFNTKVDKIVQVFSSDPAAYYYYYSPFPENFCALNIWRVNVVSAESGIDIPSESVCKNTALDCTYGDPALDQVERAIRSASPAKCFEAADHAPDYDTVLVLTNSPDPGGAYDPYSGLVFSHIHPIPQNTNHVPIVVHELAHRIGGLADEYCCAWICDPMLCDPDDIDYPTESPEPLEPNVTTARELGLLPWSNAPNSPTSAGTLAKIKWGALIDPLTAIPTNDIHLPPGTVGMWKSGYYVINGIYRPEKTCKMRKVNAKFCTVCYGVLDTKLRGYCCPEGLTWAQCEFVRLRWFESFRWMDPRARVLRIPIPPCLTCLPEELLDVVEIYFDTGFADFTLAIVDDEGEVIYESAEFGEPLEAVFSAHRGKQYFALLMPTDEIEGLDMLEIQATLIRNGALVDTGTEEVVMEF